MTSLLKNDVFADETCWDLTMTFSRAKLSVCVCVFSQKSSVVQGNLRLKLIRMTPSFNSFHTVVKR